MIGLLLCWAGWHSWTTTRVESMRHLSAVIVCQTCRRGCGAERDVSRWGLL